MLCASGLNGLIDATFAVFFPIKRQQALFIIKHGFKIDRTRPDCMNMFERVAGIIHAQIAAFMAVAQIQFTPIIVVAILNINIGLAEIG